MARPKGRPLGSILNQVLEYLPADGSELHWNEIEVKALADGMSARTFLKYMRKIDDAGKIGKRLDPASRRPRYLYSRLIGEEWEGMKRDKKAIIDLIHSAASKLKAAESEDEQHQIITALFSAVLPVVASGLAWNLSDAAAFEKKEDANAYFDVIIEIDLIPIIKELLNAIPHNPNTWKPEVEEFLNGIIRPMLPKIIEAGEKLR